MAHLKCRCGYPMWNGLTPNDVVFNVCSDRRFCELVDNPPELFSDPENLPFDIADLIEMGDYEVWLCPECKRLNIIDKKINPNKVRLVYKLEEE